MRFKPHDDAQHAWFKLGPKRAREHLTVWHPAVDLTDLGDFVRRLSEAHDVDHERADDEDDE